VCIACVVAACGGGDGPDPLAERPVASRDQTRDVLRTDLELDLSSMSGVAHIEIAPSESTGLTLEIGDLAIESVSDAVGDLERTVDGSLLDIGVPPTTQPHTVTIRYQFRDHSGFDGWMNAQGLTFLWPYFCGNLYPCKSDPSDGIAFSMAVTGATGTAIYPKRIDAEAPSYMPAVAVGEYTEVELAATSSGTAISVFHLPGEQARAAAGTAHLTEVFEFYETTYGPYAFGLKVATVSAPWGPGAFGGMEHHPFWHVASGALSSQETNAHEAAHGWFGNGVRIACWEDFVLSEGVVTYMSARALAAAGVDISRSHECDLKRACDQENTIALPGTCNDIDILTHPIWSSVPYMKGAFYLSAVAGDIGADTLDDILAEFYIEHVGQPARMRDLIGRIQDAGASPQLAIDWLESEVCPVDTSALCQ